MSALGLRSQGRTQKNCGLLAAGFTALWIFSAPAFGGSIEGQVKEVTSGDTITIQTEEGRFYKIRLMGVDAPELSQTFGRQARSFTQSLAAGKTVQVEVTLVDRFQRRIGTVTLPDGRPLHEVLVESGHAWHYPALHPVSGRLDELEKQARQHRLGLWVDTEAVPPWQFRRERSHPKPPTTLQEMDYDRYFEYGLIGNPQSRTYLWPACAGYPQAPKGWIRFGSFATAEEMGYRRAGECPRKTAQTH